jgi:hypothetical protein
MWGRPHWIIVVHRDQPDLDARLRHVYAKAPWVEVVRDRRQGERRQHAVPPGDDARLAEQRGASGHRLAYTARGYTVHEAMSVITARCGPCGLLVSFELPRFAEPPIRLDVEVVHEVIQPKHPRHAVELRAATATRAEALALRLTAVTRMEPG